MGRAKARLAKWSLGLTVLGLSLTACVSGPVRAPEPENSSSSALLPPVTTGPVDSVGDELNGLNDMSFVSTTVSGSPLIAGHPQRVVFRNGRVDVGGGCNGAGGEVDSTDGVLQVALGSTTMKGCAPDLLALDDAMAGFLASGPRWQLQGEVLTLTTSSIQLTLQQEHPGSPAALTSFGWRVSGVAEPPGTTTPVGDRTSAWLRVVDSGSGSYELTFDTGCTRAHATAELTERSWDGALTAVPLVFESISATCDGMDLRIDQLVRTVLSGAITYRVQDRGLILTDVAGTHQVQFQVDTDIGSPVPTM